MRSSWSYSLAFLAGCSYAPVSDAVKESPVKTNFARASEVKIVVCTKYCADSGKCVCTQNCICTEDLVAALCARDFIGAAKIAEKKYDNILAAIFYIHEGHQDDAARIGVSEKDLCASDFGAPSKSFCYSNKNDIMRAIELYKTAGCYSDAGLLLAVLKNAENRFCKPAVKEEISELFEKDGFLESARYVFNTDDVSNLAIKYGSERDIIECIHNKEFKNLDDWIDSMKSFDLSAHLKKRIISSLESAGLYENAGRLSLYFFDDKKRAYANFKKAKIDSKTLAELANEISKESESAGDYVDALFYAKEADLLCTEFPLSNGLVYSAKTNLTVLIESGEFKRAKALAELLGDKKQQEGLDKIIESVKNHLIKQGGVK